MAVGRTVPLRRAIRLAATVAVLGALFALQPVGGAAAAPSGWRSIAFGSVTFEAPSSWPTVNAVADPSACVRFDRRAVYLGTQGPDARCPARAVGRTDAVQVEALSQVPPEPLGPAQTTPGGLPYRPVLGTETSRIIEAEFPSVGVRVTVAYRRDPATAQRILGSFALAHGAHATTQASRPTAPAAGPATPSLQGVGGTIYQGLGVDMCTAPSESSMRAWLASPYRMAGIYVGGVNRACSQPNLTPAWVAAVQAMGWRFIPTYVGLQAPCARQQGFATIDPDQAAPEGVAAADDIAAQAAALGLGEAAPAYFDMESYDPTDGACDLTVETFLSAYVGEMHKKHLMAGVYGGAASTISQLASYYDDKGWNRPDDVWIAHWDGRQEVFGDSYVSDDVWTVHQRLHQYQGQHDETWGGVRIQVDNDVADGGVVGLRRHLVFAGPGGGPREIFAVGADGIGLRQLTHDGADDYAPTLSPDGTKVAYTSNSGGEYNVWVVNADGTGAHKVTFSTHYDGYPSWSPGGSKLAFQSNRTGRENIWVANADGTGLQQLTATSSADDVRPTWSPNGTVIAFHSDRTGNNDVWVVGASGGGLKRLTWKTSADQDPSWAPDGSLIAFETNRTGNFEIFTIKPTGAGARQVSFDPASDNAATWSPDAQRIVFTSDRTGSTQVFVMDRDGANAIQLTFGGSVNQLPSWAS